MQVKPLHRVVKNNLNDLRFKCKNSSCKEVNYYEEAIKHIYKCPKNWTDCI